jgi:hypothetical protein
MIELREWMASASFPDRPWLVLGKGPSFSRRAEFPLGEYNLMGLNNVVGELPEHRALGHEVLEHYEPGRTKLLHYTVVPTQPWKNDKNPLRDVWMADFEEAKAAGILHQDEIQTLVRKGHVKPSLATLGGAGGKVKLVYYRTLTFLQRVLQAAEARLPLLRHPAVMRARSRLGRAMGA